ncbi:hypothetical protein JHK85_006874 [Glycine max]|uniref:CCHC-type domain-containing protein n=1 Tax=Glycine soja TaxID=3848 RepID=A0A445L8U9_GLYSO|nr:hypothetical protein JHK85_006874 [Glycine max]KAG5071466.1 hypothetical protein JHK86_006677 [Glycine max]RZC19557.1 hypothetical protein D0Y65_006406 [Glycine soja]
MLCALSEKKYSKVKRNKLSLVSRKYELFSMEENEDIQCMFGCFQANLNELRSLGRTYDNYDHIDKILRSISRNWRPQVIVLRDLKNLDSMSLWKLVATLKVHEQVLYGEAPQEEYPETRRKKTKSFIVCNECKKPEHFKSECPDLEKNQDMKKFFSTKEKKGLMKEDDEEANIWMMADITFEGFELYQKDEVNFDDPKSLRKAYHELLSYSYIVSKAYKNLRRDFKNLSQGHLKLEKTL